MTVGTVLTAEDAYELVAKAQYEKAVSWQTKYYTENPDRLRGLALEQKIALLDQNTVDWGEGPTEPTEVDGHIVQQVVSFGGEGQGETRYVVYDIDGQLFRKDGYYASHYGTDWDGDWREVQAVQRQVTFYE